jgi:Tol biopolymer transport system component
MKYEIPSDGGNPQQLALFGPTINDEPVNPSRDGKWWYFTSDKTGRFEIWKASPQRGTAVQVTRNGGRYPQESADGRYIYYSGAEVGSGVWRIPAEGGSEQKLIESLSRPPNYQVTDEGIYYIPTAGPDGTTIRLLRFATGETEVLAKLDKPITYGFSVSPDRRTILYAQVDQDAADLELVENFR